MPYGPPQKGWAGAVRGTDHCEGPKKEAKMSRDPGQEWGQPAEGDKEQERWRCPGRAKEAGASMGLGLKMKG